MPISVAEFYPDYLAYAGTIGILLGLFLFILFFYRRIRWIILALSRQKAVSPRLLASLRNFLLIIIWTSVFGMLLFWGFFLRSYHAFTYEEPVAEIITRAVDGTDAGPAALVQYSSLQPQSTRYLAIKGDQWMIEGDILKWDSWLNFMGLHTRFRLTRLRGRYIDSEAERRQPHTIYSLVDDENHPLWRYLYRYGHRLPFVSAVYGSAAFQASRENRRYLIYVGRSGFIVREKHDEV